MLRALKTRNGSEGIDGTNNAALSRWMPRLQRWKLSVASCPGALPQAFAFRAFDALARFSVSVRGLAGIANNCGEDLLASSDNTRVLASILSYLSRFNRCLNGSIRRPSSFSRHSLSKPGAQPGQLAPARGVTQIVQQ